jgi:hypothetical protein
MGGALQSIALDGGTVTSHHDGEVTALKVHETRVYFADASTETLYTMNGDGSGKTPLVSGTGTVNDVAVGGGFVWWSATGTNGDPPFQRVPEGGGAAEALVTDLSTSVLYLVSNPSVLYASILNGATTSLHRLALDNPVSFEPVGSNLSIQFLSQLFIDASHTYYAADGLARIAHAATEAEPLANIDNISGVVVEGQTAFVTADASGSCQPGAGSVIRVPLDTKQPEVMVSGQDCPRGIAIDPAGLYWVNSGTRLGSSLLADPETAKLMRAPRI